MPSSTPARSPSVPGTLVVNPTMPSNTPGCLERRNVVIARSQHTVTTPTNRTNLSFLTRILRSHLVDLYANRPQHLVLYLFICHMSFFYIVYQYQQAGGFKNGHGDDTTVNVGLYYACYDEIMPFCLYTGIVSQPFRNFFSLPP